MPCLNNWQVAVSREGEFVTRPLSGEPSRSRLYTRGGGCAPEVLKRVTDGLALFDVVAAILRIRRSRLT